MRLFIAIPLPEETKKYLDSLTQPLKDCYLQASWVKFKNLHITLKFLGEIDEADLGPIKKTLSEIADKFTAFEAKLTDFGFFPNQQRPRVFFISTDQAETLTKISQDVEESIKLLGFPKENRFHSHITLARIKGPKNLTDLTSKLDSIEPSGTFKIDSLALYKSTLTDTGSIYEKIYQGKLK